MDRLLGVFMQKIEVNNLTHINIILVSDHGMTNSTEALYVGNYTNLTYFDLNRTDFSIVSNIRLNPQVDVSFTTTVLIFTFQPIFTMTNMKKRLQKQVAFNSLKNIPNVDVYYKEQVPERFNYRSSDRIGWHVLVKILIMLRWTVGQLCFFF